MDHHTLSVDDLQLRDSVVEVIDHRPQDPNWLWPGTKISVDPVGSCATLVAKNILTRNPKIMDDQLRCLLRGEYSSQMIWSTLLQKKVFVNKEKKS